MRPFFLNYPFRQENICFSWDFKFTTRIFVHEHVYTIMKTKLTLTVNEDVIIKARKQSKAAGRSISQLFEEFIQDAAARDIKSETQLAAGRLLKRISASKPVTAVDDEMLLKKMLTDKYG